MDRLAKVFVLALSWTSLVLGMHFEILYECQPNGDIIVHNPDSSILYSLSAGTTSSVLQVTATADLMEFLIHDAPKDTEITISFSTRTQVGDGIVGGSYIEAYTIQCNELSEDGVFFTSSIGLIVQAKAATNETRNVTTHMPHYDEPPVTPTFTVSSVMWNSAKTRQVSKANVGDQLKWEIKGPAQYDLLPTCSANAGTSPGGSPSVAVVADGCGVVEMVSDFASVSGNPVERGDIISDFWAFKFISSVHLTLSCTVRVCARGDATCTQTCARRRRDIFYLRPESVTAPGAHIHVVSHLDIENAGSTIQGLSFTLLTSLSALSWGLKWNNLRI